MPALAKTVAGSLALAALLWSASAAAEPQVGAVVGGNYSLLSQPADPAGEPTLLSGTAFDGAGFVVGAAMHYPLTEVGGTPLELEVDLLYSSHSAEGFEERPGSDARRTVTLDTQVLRVPVLVALRGQPGENGFRVGVGVEPMWGLQSGATTEVERGEASADPLFTTPAFHLGATVALGFDWAVADRLSVPIEVRTTWDPFVGESTRERFDGYESFEEPGEYEVAFDWQVLFLTGVNYQL